MVACLWVSPRSGLVQVIVDAKLRENFGPMYACMQQCLAISRNEGISTYGLGLRQLFQTPFAMAILANYICLDIKMMTVETEP